MTWGRTVVDELRRRPFLADALLAAALALAFLVLPQVLPSHVGNRETITMDLTGPDVVLTLTSALALSQRRRWPAAVLLATSIATFATLAGDWSVNLSHLALALAMYGYALRSPRRHAVVAAVVSSVVLGATSVLADWLLKGEWGPQDVVLLIWTATALALSTQSRRAAMSALHDRARRAEETREETALRRVAEDRVRIARELHDVIAHHVAVISVQAGVAEHLIERDPPAAAEALRHVRASSKGVLVELQSVLRVLRQDEEHLPTGPTPGVGDLDNLVTSFRSIGTRVTVTRSGLVPPLAPAADLAAFRLVQEALTNVQKHAEGARATVTLTGREASLEIAVANGPAPRATGSTGMAPWTDASGSGLGLVGMRERVAAAGGELQTGATSDGGFRVVARLPAGPVGAAGQADGIGQADAVGRADAAGHTPPSAELSPAAEVAR